MGETLKGNGFSIGPDDNANIDYPDAAGSINIDDIEAARETIERSAIFATQVEQSISAAQKWLEITSKACVVNCIDPAPAEEIPDEMFPLCDQTTPSESEKEAIVGFPLVSVDDGDIGLEEFRLLSRFGTDELGRKLGHSNEIELEPRPPVSATFRFGASQGSLAPSLDRSTGHPVNMRLMSNLHRISMPKDQTMADLSDEIPNAYRAEKTGREKKSRSGPPDAHSCLRPTV